jgi:serine protease AprX
VPTSIVWTTQKHNRYHLGRTTLAAQPSGDQDGYLQVWLSNQLVASLTIGQIAIVAAMNSVASISLALTVRSCIDQAVTRISANTTQSTRTGNDQVVALLDSGINSAHPYLPSSQIKHQKHYVGSNTDDEFGHGTHLAGVIAGKHSLYKGIAPDATIWSYRVLDQQGKSAGTTSLLTAVQDLVSDAIALSPTQPVIANCSFAVPLSSFASEKDYEDFCDPFDNATSDLVVVSAAGNEGPDPATITAPGGGFRVITVGASVSRPGASLNFVSPYSSRGPATNQRDKPDVVAPGGFRNPKGEANKEVSMVSTRLASGTLDSLTSNDKPWQVDAEHFGLSGTSQATAVVSAACALILEELTLRNRSVTHAEVANALRKSAQTLGFTTYEQGQGLIDVDEAIAKI